MKLKYVKGYKKGQLTILEREGSLRKGIRLTVHCGYCDKIKIFTNLPSFMRDKSCGCGRIKHGIFSKDEKWYDRWRSMLRRCYDVNNNGYVHYGGRGIKVCDRWRDRDDGLVNYYNDIHTILGPQPSEEHTLDRIDNDGDYEIGNLRWATKKEQSQNRRPYYMN